MRRPALALSTGVVILLLAASPILFMKTGVSGVNTFPDGFESKRASPSSTAVLRRAVSPVLSWSTARRRRRPCSPASPTHARAGRRQVLRAAADADRRVGHADAPLGAGERRRRRQLAAANGVRDLRATWSPAFADTEPASTSPGRPPATSTTSTSSTAYFPWVFALVLSLSFLLLLVAFRSIVIPAKAIVMNLLSVGPPTASSRWCSLRGVGAGVLGSSRCRPSSNGCRSSSSRCSSASPWTTRSSCSAASRRPGTDPATTRPRSPRASARRPASSPARR